MDPRGENDPLISGERQSIFPGNGADADAGALQITENTQVAVMDLVELPQDLDAFCMFFVGAMGEIHADDVEPGLHHVAQDRRRFAGRPDCGDDLCVYHFEVSTNPAYPQSEAQDR